MHPHYVILGISLPTYGALCALAGLAAGACILARRRFFSIAREDAVNLLAVALAGGLTGALALYWVTAAPEILRHWDELIAEPVRLLAALLGLVFYGGLLGGALAVILYVRRYKLPFDAVCDMMIPAMPLTHAIGRVGCFMGGCCYAVPVPWGIAFTEAVGAPNGVPLLPVQLIEAGVLLLLFAALLLLERGMLKKDPAAHGWALPVYLLAYAPARFVLEFFRGDAIRGFAWGISTSQWISAGLFVIGVAAAVRRRKLPARAYIVKL